MSARNRETRAGYTLVEVMMALGILAVGATGIVGLQQAAIRGNQEANEYATATRTAEMWLDRYRMDALSWRTGGLGTLPSAALFANTELMQGMPAAGATGWHAPLAIRPAAFPPANQLSQHGNPSPAAGSPTPIFCTQANLSWIYDGTAIRVDVRVSWRRRGSSPAAALACPAIPDRTQFHVVPASTVIRWTPENPRRI